MAKLCDLHAKAVGRTVHELAPQHVVLHTSLLSNCCSTIRIRTCPAALCAVSPICYVADDNIMSKCCAKQAKKVCFGDSFGSRKRWCDQSELSCEVVGAYRTRQITTPPTETVFDAGYLDQPRRGNQRRSAKMRLDTKKDRPYLPKTQFLSVYLPRFGKIGSKNRRWGCTIFNVIISYKST